MNQSLLGSSTQSALASASSQIKTAPVGHRGYPCRQEELIPVVDINEFADREHHLHSPLVVSLDFPWERRTLPPVLVVNQVAFWPIASARVETFLADELNHGILDTGNGEGTALLKRYREQEDFWRGRERGRRLSSPKPEVELALRLKLMELEE